MAVTGVIVQARLGSTRLPGKVLKHLGGQSVLSHVLERCRAIDGVDVVCCAVPNTSADQPVVDEASRCGAVVFRGSELDVLDRYYRAAKALGMDVVMRITSDCPLIDPKLCRAVLELRAGADADYACNNMPPTWPHGLDCEAITFDWLEYSAKAAQKSFEREHVTQFVRAHPGARKVNLPFHGPSIDHHRWTLDTLSDLRFLRALFCKLPAGTEAWDHRTVLATLATEPTLAAINAGQDRYAGLKASMAGEENR